MNRNEGPWVLPLETLVAGFLASTGQRWKPGELTVPMEELVATMGWFLEESWEGWEKWDFLKTRERGALEAVMYSVVWKGVDPEETLVKCSCQGFLGCVEALLDWGVDVHCDGDWSLINASMGGHLNTVKLLVKRGADIHAEEDSSIVYASMEGHAQVVKFLLEQGALVHAQEKDGGSLELASYYGHLEVVRVLLSFGTFSQETLNRCLKRNNSEIAEAILSSCQ